MIITLQYVSLQHGVSYFLFRFIFIFYSEHLYCMVDYVCSLRVNTFMLHLCLSVKSILTSTLNSLFSCYSIYSLLFHSML